ATTGTLTLTGAASWTGGTISGAGGVTVASGGTWTLSGSGTKALGINNQAGGSGSISVSGTLIHSGSGALQYTGVAGAGSNESLTIASGGIYDLQGDSSITLFNAIGTVTNNGTFRKSAGATGSTVSSTFSNTGGTIDVQTSSLTLAAGG